MAVRGRGERNQVQVLEDQVIFLRLMARRLWQALKARNALEAEALFYGDAMRIADAAYDAAEIVFDKHRVSIMPCRVVLDPGGRASVFGGWPTQAEMYIGHWPDGSSRNLTRAQVLMMGGLDPDEGCPEADLDREMPF